MLIHACGIQFIYLAIRGTKMDTETNLNRFSINLVNEETKCLQERIVRDMDRISQQTCLNSEDSGIMKKKKETAIKNPGKGLAMITTATCRKKKSGAQRRKAKKKRKGQVSSTILESLAGIEIDKKDKKFCMNNNASIRRQMYRPILKTPRIGLQICAGKESSTNNNVSIREVHHCPHVLEMSPTGMQIYDGQESSTNNDALLRKIYPSSISEIPLAGMQMNTCKKDWTNDDFFFDFSSTKKVTKNYKLQEINTLEAIDDSMTRAIVLEGYPQKEITLEQLTLLRDAIVVEIANIQEGPWPQFVGTAILKNGAVIIKSADEISLRWLENLIGKISPWDGARLRVTALAESQRWHKATAWIPGTPKLVETVLNLLEKQNPGVGVRNWKILAENVDISPDGQNLIFDIMESNVRKLKALDFKLHYGIEQITIKMISSCEQKVKTEKSMPEVSLY